MRWWPNLAGVVSAAALVVLGLIGFVTEGRALWLGVWIAGALLVVTFLWMGRSERVFERRYGVTMPDLRVAVKRMKAMTPEELSAAFRNGDWPTGLGR